MILSLRGWIAAVSLVGVFAWASFAGAAQAESAQAEAVKAAPTQPVSADKPEGKADSPKPDESKPSGPAAEAKPVEAKPAEAAAAPEAKEDVKTEPKAEASETADKPETAAKPEAPAGEKPAAAKEAAHGGEADAAAPHGDGAHGDAGHGSGHGHHDPTDLSHANDGPGHANLAPRALTGIQELKADLAIYTFIVFLLLAGVLLKFGWKPIMSGLDKREQSIRDLIAQAERNAAQAEASLKQHQAKLATAAEEVRELQVKARRDAETLGEEILAKARAEASRDRERALADIEAAKNLALREIAQKSVNTAVSLAGRILQREVNAADHVQLINDALEKFPSRN